MLSQAGLGLWLRDGRDRRCMAWILRRSQVCIVSTETIVGLEVGLQSIRF